MGKRLRNVAGSTALHKAITHDARSPFCTEYDLNLPSWFVRSTLAKSQMVAYAAEGLGGTESRSFWSAYTLRQYLDVMNAISEYLIWVEAGIDDGRHATTLYYRPMIDCVCYVIHQVAYTSDIIYAPISEYDSRGE